MSGGLDSGIWINGLGLIGPFIYFAFCLYKNGRPAKSFYLNLIIICLGENNYLKERKERQKKRGLLSCC